MKDMRIQTELRRTMDTTPAGQPIRVIVKYKAGVRAAEALVHPQLVVTREFNLVPAAAGTATAEAITALQQSPDVEMVWLDMPVHTWLDVSVPLIGAPQVWAAGYTGKGIIVAIVDTGVDVNHPDLAGRVTLTKDFSGEGFTDNHGHGTHVAGITAGNGTAGSGKYKGVAPEATIYAAKVLRGNGSGLMSDVMAGVEWAVQQNAQVINLSLGSDGSCDGSDAMSAVCDAAVDQGVMMCVAAGNAGPNYYTVGSPGCARKVLTVGASDDNDAVTSFSSRGPTADKRLKPEILFPGYHIVSCRASGTSMGTVVDSYYTEASGTSMATPHATGVCALLLQAKPALTPQAIKDLLVGSAKILGADLFTYGYGRGDVYQAYLGQTHPLPPIPAPPGEPGGCLQAVLQAIGLR
jgi:serine protease AprX